MIEEESALEKDESPASGKQADTCERAGVNREHGHTTEAQITKREGSLEQPEVDEYGLRVEKKNKKVEGLGDDAATSDDDTSTSSHKKDWSTPPESAAQDDGHHKDVEEHEINDTSRPFTKKDESPDADHPSEVPSSSHEQSSHRLSELQISQLSSGENALTGNVGIVSEWSHQALAPPKEDTNEKKKKKEQEWQTMPAYASYDLYDDEGHLVAKEAPDSDEEANAYHGLGGAGKGYTRVQIDEDAQSATSMDDNTNYLFKSKGTDLSAEDDEARDALSQLQATKELLTEGQRIAYVGITRLSMAEMIGELDKMESTKATKKAVALSAENTKMWSQKMMVRLYKHMDIDSSEQVMIEQLAEHGVLSSDMTPALMQNARVKNPMADESDTSKSLNLKEKGPRSTDSSLRDPNLGKEPTVDTQEASPISEVDDSSDLEPLPAYKEYDSDAMPEVRTPTDLGTGKNIDIDLRWTVLCDLFLVVLSDSIYDARSRTLLERVGESLKVPWVDICRFEKRVTDALEMEEEASKETWDEAEHLETRRKRALRRRYMMMGLATAGGGLVIGLSAGLLAPVIGAGLAAGFTTIGVAGTSGFLAGAGGAAIITSTGVLTGGTIAVRASRRRTGAVSTFEYRPLHNNKRVNLIVTISGWMNGKVDDVRLPFSTVDPIMGDMYSLLWEPEMLQSMGQTINILASEALSQTIQQILGSTILIALMSALQLPIVLTKLSYLIDNPWTVSMARANAAGLILADSLIDRNLGMRPITLVGFSLGARVIFAALRELAGRGAFGIIQNVYLFGSPVVASRDEYLRARSMISGRFVNGYASNDWILAYLFRATSGGVMRVAGLAKVENVSGLENIDVTKLVNGHMAYRAAMPRLLREVGWEVESDEFTEIEDPDPENHEGRQRELIQELENARKGSEQKPGKKRFSFFKRGKFAERKKWETYDDSAKASTADDYSTSAAEGQSGNMLFDIEAIKRELESEAIEVKQLESTMPPMKVSSDGSAMGTEQKPYASLRESKSYDETMAYRIKDEEKQSLQASLPNGVGVHQQENPFNQGYDDYNIFDDAVNGRDSAEEPKLSFGPPRESPSSEREKQVEPDPATPPTRPSLGTTMSSPSSATEVSSLDHNAWANEDEDFGQEQEVKLTF